MFNYLASGPPGAVLEDDRDTTAPPAITTLSGLLLRSAALFPKPDAFKFKRNGEWVDIPTDEFIFRVEELFFALRALGVKRGARVAIMSENCVEWAVADYAILCAGAITVPIYPTLSAAQVQALLRDSEASAAFVSTAALLEKIKTARGALESLHFIIAFDPDLYEPGVIRLEALYNTGRQSAYDYPAEFRRSARDSRPEDVATIIYTSGTTGVPKGVMLTHRNLVSNILATMAVLPLTPEDTELSFLPLAHILQRHVDYASVYTGSTIAYAESLTAVVDNMAEVRPTFAAGVPRFFEKVYERIMSQVAEAPALRRAVFNAAIRTGKDSIGSEKKPLYNMFDRLVYQKIRHRLGGRIRFFISGGAALEREVEEFFFAVGLPILEGYGLTETSPVITLNAPGEARIGCVGRAVGDVEIRIAPDGEILVRGSNVMKGYYKMKRETEAAFCEGWFRTGDIGQMDADRYLKITDRKKDLIVTSNGKNVAPQPIENRLKLIPYFENVVVVGDGRNFISALIVPNFKALAACATAHRIAFDRPEELTHMPQIYDLAMHEIQRQMADFAAFEQVKKVVFLDKPFTIDGGDLTPTMKVRRSTIEKKYKADIEHLYAA